MITPSAGRRGGDAADSQREPRLLPVLRDPQARAAPAAPLESAQTKLLEEAAAMLPP